MIGAGLKIALDAALAALYVADQMASAFIWWMVDAAFTLARLMFVRDFLAETCF